jgi:hypothetical protein
MYNYITAWGRMMGSYDYYILQQIEKAKQDNAPSDACYFNDFEQKWVCYSDINSKIQMKLDLCDLKAPNTANAVTDSIILVTIFYEDYTINLPGSPINLIFLYCSLN